MIMKKPKIIDIEENTMVMIRHICAEENLTPKIWIEKLIEKEVDKYQVETIKKTT